MNCARLAEVELGLTVQHLTEVAALDLVHELDRAQAVLRLGDDAELWLALDKLA